MTEPDDDQAQTPSRVLTDAERAERAMHNRATPLPAGNRRAPVPLNDVDPRKC